MNNDIFIKELEKTKVIRGNTRGYIVTKDKLIDILHQWLDKNIIPAIEKIDQVTTVLKEPLYFDISNQNIEIDGSLTIITQRKEQNYNLGGIIPGLSEYDTVTGNDVLKLFSSVFDNEVKDYEIDRDKIYLFIDERYYNSVRLNTIDIEGVYCPLKEKILSTQNNCADCFHFAGIGKDETILCNFNAEMEETMIDMIANISDEEYNDFIDKIEERREDRIKEKTTT